MTPPALAAWHKFLETRDWNLLEGLLAEDAVFHSPVVHTPQVGRPLVMLYLRGASQTFEGHGFRYLREVVGEQDAVLEFLVEVEGIQINGIDLIRWNDAHKIIDFKVMVRPLKAINLLHQKMKAQLEALQAGKP